MMTILALGLRSLELETVQIARNLPHHLQLLILAPVAFTTGSPNGSTLITMHPVHTVPPMHPMLPGDRRGPEPEQKRGIGLRIRQRIKLTM